MTFDLSNCPFSFLDLETTGLSPWFGDRICEVAIVSTEGKRIRETYQILINPERPLSPGAASTNGIQDEWLKAAPKFAPLAGKIESMLANTVIVCHNAQFDLQFLDSELRRLGKEPQFPNVIDTLHIARHFDLASYSLSNVAAQFGFTNPEAHRAKGDALTTKNVFFAMLEQLRGIKSLDDFIGIYSSPAWPHDVIQLPTGLAEAIASGKRLHITYVDKNGERTVRWITPSHVTGHTDYLYLHARCHLREDDRTFRLDRIVKMSIEPAA
jgi:DNA polymerase-3 subunit epsilon